MTQYGAAATGFVPATSAPDGKRRPAAVVPNWLARLDAAVLALLNLVPLSEAAIVVVDTVLRAFFGGAWAKFLDLPPALIKLAQAAPPRCKP